MKGRDEVKGGGLRGVEGAPRGGYLFGGEHFLGRGCLFKEILYT